MPHATMSFFSSLLKVAVNIMFPLTEGISDNICVFDPLGDYSLDHSKTLEFLLILEPDTVGPLLILPVKIPSVDDL